MLKSSLVVQVNSDELRSELSVISAAHRTALRDGMAQVGSTY